MQSAQYKIGGCQPVFTRFSIVDIETCIIPLWQHRIRSDVALWIVAFYRRPFLFPYP